MEEIKEMYNQLRPKGDFIKAASKKFGISQASVRVHYLSNEEIPKEKIEEVKKLMKTVLQEQKDYAKKIGL